MSPLWGGGEEEREPGLEAARAEAEGALPEGWELVGSDKESFGWVEADIVVHGALATGPAGEFAVAIAVTESEAFRQLARRLRGKLEVSDGWAPPVP